MRATTIVMAAAIAAAQWGCGSSDKKHDGTATAPSVTVRAVEVRETEWPSVYEASGTVQAKSSATLSSKVMGYIREVRVQPGDSVRAGQLLVVLEARDLESAVQQARAGEQEARSAIAEADNAIAAAKAQLALAQVTFRRMDDLYKKKSISDQEYDEARARVDTARANFEMARSRRAQLDAKIAQAQTGVQTASVMRSYSEVRAPFSGVVTAKQADAGQLATPGAPLLTIEQAGAYRLEAPVEESMLGSVKLRQAVMVELDATDQTLSGRVDEIVPSVDPGSRAFVVKASLPPSASLRSGVYGRLKIARGSRSALVIPAAAVQHRGELESVLVADNGVARMRMVTTGARRDEQVEVLSGLAQGERVIYPRPAGLVDGARVEVRP